jgi:MoxR-like ATPase
MMQRFIADEPLRELSPVAEGNALISAAEACRLVRVDVDVMQYMAKLCEAARDPEKVRLGPSPRALLALMRACQALAAIRGREYVIPDDVKELAVPVLAHRVILRGVQYRTTAEEFIGGIVSRIPVPTEAAL